MSLQLCDVHISIAQKIIVQRLNITFNRGEFWGVMGVNGVGKTTLLRSLIGLYDLDDGMIQLDGKNIKDYTRLELAQLSGMMHQEYDYNFPSTVLEATLIGRHPFIESWQWESPQDTQCAYNALRKVGLYHLSERMVNTLSGGEKRRLNLATLLTQNPDYYLLDEPINHLDLKAQVDMLSLLKTHFKHEQQCGVMVIHDPNLAYRFCDHILLLLSKGHYLKGPTKDILNQNNLSQLYDCPVHQIHDAQHTIFVPLASV